MNVYLLALLIGVLAGLRTMLAPAAVSWAAHLGWISVKGTWLAFLGYRFTPWILTIMAVGELITDQLAVTPSRKVPVQFLARCASGALCGAAMMATGPWINGLICGVIGAVIGTLGGYEGRRRLATVFHRDRPAAFIEDAAAILGSYLVVKAAGA